MELRVSGRLDGPEGSLPAIRGFCLWVFQIGLFTDLSPLTTCVFTICSLTTCKGIANGRIPSGKGIANGRIPSGKGIANGRG